MTDILFEKVSKSFGDKVIFDQFDEQFPHGQVTMIMAPSGRGKTTLLSLILGLEKVDNGRILGIPDNISVAFQEDALCPQLSVLDNIRLALPQVEKAKIIDALCAVGLQGEQNTKAADLSGGMGRRVSVVRAMLHDAPLILLDEPFRGLDDKAKRELGAFISSHRGGRTLLFISHDAADYTLLGASKMVNL